MTEESNPTSSLRDEAARLNDTGHMVKSWTPAIHQEIQNARRNHGPTRTPQNPDMPDGEKLAILMCELGEVAEAITYRHRKNLKPELLQVATMALLWYHSL